jgi:hypothetical protein
MATLWVHSMEIIETLNQASQGLLMPSESEFPFESFLWLGVDTLTSERLLTLTDHALDAQVEETDLEYLFRNVAVEKDWHDEVQRAEVSKFQQLQRVLEANLSDIKVYRVGVINLDVYIVGKLKAGEGMAGLRTTLVET